MPPMGGSANEGSTAVEMQPMTGESDINSLASVDSSASSNSDRDAVDSPRFNEELQSIASQNHYELRKKAVQAILSLPLMTANFAQIRSIVTTERRENVYFSCVLGLVISSLALQVLYFILILVAHKRERVLDRREKEKARALKQTMLRGAILFIDGPNGRRRRRRHSVPAESIDVTSSTLLDEPDEDCCLDTLNYASLFIVFFITVVNFVILGMINIPEKTNQNSAL